MTSARVEVSATATSHHAPPAWVAAAGSVAMTMTEVRVSPRVSTSAASSSARLATFRDRAPRLAACAAKSTPEPSANRLLNEEPPQLRCSRSMQPNPPLSSTTILSFLPSCTEVAISEFSIR
jgi:hypothetical protein